MRASARRQLQLLLLARWQQMRLLISASASCTRIINSCSAGGPLPRPRCRRRLSACHAAHALRPRPAQHTAYDRKKYVWKLLYIYMLGYDVEFGHKQACDLIPAQKCA